MQAPIVKIWQNSAKIEIEPLIMRETSGRTWMILGLLVTLIGGGSLLIALGLVFFFTVGPGGPQREPTVIADLPTADDAPTQPLIRTRPPTAESSPQPTPTFLPVADNGGGVSPGEVTPDSPVNGGGFLESPSQSVVNYYRDITAGNYNATWSQLTDGFKQEFNCCAPDYDYAGYTSWWDMVARVDFGEVRTVEQRGDTALVYAELIYTMEEGGSFEDSSPYIQLVYSDEQGRWLFEDKRSEQ